MSNSDELVGYFYEVTDSITSTLHISKISIVTGQPKLRRQPGSFELLEEEEEGLGLGWRLERIGVIAKLIKESYRVCPGNPY